MILAPAKMELETLERESGTKRETCCMGGRALRVGYLHLVGLSEVIAGCQIDVLT